MKIIEQIDKHYLIFESQLLDSYNSNKLKFMLTSFMIWGLMIGIAIAILIIKYNFPNLMESGTLHGEINVTIAALVWASPLIIAIIIFKAKQKSKSTIKEHQ